MKKRMAALVLLLIMLFASTAFGLADYGEHYLAKQKLSTRNGPGTKYRDCATYNLKGEMVHILSFEFDNGGVCWVEFEFTFKNKPVRLYTGLKRFNATMSDFAQDGVYEKIPMETMVKVIRTCKAKYGPGDEYLTYDKLTIDRGQEVKVITLENDWIEVEWTTAKCSYRAWMPLSAVRGII